MSCPKTKIIINSEAAKKVGFFDEHLITNEDIDYYMRTALLYPKVGYVTTPTAIIRMRKESLSKNEKDDNFNLIIDKLFALISSSNKEISERVLPIAALLTRTSLHRAIYRKAQTKIRFLLSGYSQLLLRRDIYMAQMALFSPRISRLLLLTFRKYKAVWTYLRDTIGF